MTQTDPDYTDDNDLDDAEENSPTVQRLRKAVKAAEKKAREAEERAEANTAAVRRVAFLDAGIPDTPTTRFYRDHYQGELTPEAIKADAIANGFLAEEDHSAEIDAIGGQSEGLQGGQAPRPVGGDQAEYEREIDEAVRKAPRGQEAKAIKEVYDRYVRTV